AAELVDRDRALALVADVDQHLAGADVHDATAYHLALFELVGGDAFAEPVFHAFLGLLVAALLSQAAEGFALVLLHSAQSSRSGFEGVSSCAPVPGGRPGAVAPPASPAPPAIFPRPPAWWSFCPPFGPRRSKTRGRPNVTTPFARRGKRRPRGQARPL